MQAFINQHLWLDVFTNATNFQDTWSKFPLKSHIKKLSILTEWPQQIPQENFKYNSVYIDVTDKLLFP